MRTICILIKSKLFSLVFIADKQERQKGYLGARWNSLINCELSYYVFGRPQYLTFDCLFRLNLVTSRDVK